MIGLGFMALKSTLYKKEPVCIIALLPGFIGPSSASSIRGGESCLISFFSKYIININMEEGHINRSYRLIHSKPNQAFEGIKK